MRAELRAELRDAFIRALQPMVKHQEVAADAILALHEMVELLDTQCELTRTKRELADAKLIMAEMYRRLA